MLLAALFGVVALGVICLVRSERRVRKSNATSQKLTPLGAIITFAIVIGFFYLVAFILQLLAPILGIILGLAALVIVVL